MSAPESSSAPMADLGCPRARFVQTAPEDRGNLGDVDRSIERHTGKDDQKTTGLADLQVEPSSTSEFDRIELSGSPRVSPRFRCHALFAFWRSASTRSSAALNALLTADLASPRGIDSQIAFISSFVLSSISLVSHASNRSIIAR